MLLPQARICTELPERSMSTARRSFTVSASAGRCEAAADVKSAFSWNGIPLECR